MMRASFLRRPFRYSNDSLCLWLVAVNILVYAAGYLFPSLTYLLAMNPMGVLAGRLWQPFTYMFAHASLSHLLVNMFGLFIFGMQVERALGSKEFLLYYLVTGFLAGLFSFVAYLLTGAYGVFLLGASGAVFAVQLAYAALFPDSRLLLWGIIPVRAPMLVLGYTAIEVYSQLFGFRSSVAHLTHLAGFGFGWIYFLLRFGINPGRRFFPRP